MTDARLKFGDVVRVDPEANPKVHQPDDRRWMIVSAATTGRQWEMVYIGPSFPGTLSVFSHWPNLLGFVKVDDKVVHDDWWNEDGTPR